LTTFFAFGHFLNTRNLAVLFIFLPAASDTIIDAWLIELVTH